MEEVDEPVSVETETKITDEDLGNFPDGLRIDTL